MTPLIQLKRTIPLLLVTFLLASFALLHEAQAVETDPEDYFPGGNTATGQNALLNLREGTFNTAVGLFSLNTLIDGTFNTGVGAGTLLLNTGNNNTATGAAALLSNTTGGDNTAHGVGALASNDTGSQNTANGALALFSNTVADRNTAMGYGALQNNTEGGGNTANGAFALFSNTEGVQNTAMGLGALRNNTTGQANMADGWNALFNNTEGNFNTAIGWDALGSNTTGDGNTAVGYGAGFTNTTGGNNTALGAFAGKGVTTAHDVVCIGNGLLGGDVNDSTWIANIYGVTTQSGTTAPVVVSDGGQLGTIASSQRFKKDIAAMDKASEVILSLRPVTFHYKTDARETSQFGLIAEEVAKVNPDLVLPDNEGKPYTVRYDSVNAMLLNEFLKEHRMVQEQGAMIAQQQKQIEALTTAVQRVSAQLELSKGAPQTVLNNP